jgi:hypothetical protein
VALPTSEPKSTPEPFRPIERVLGRLEDVRQIAVDSWVARCTAHEDTHPSLSVKETPDGTVLVRCRVGCSGADIVRNAGLSWVDLFPRGRRERRRPRTWMGIVPMSGNGRPSLESFGDPVVGDMIAELARLAHVRGRLDVRVAGALRLLAAAVDVSPERLRESIADALATEEPA